MSGSTHWTPTDSKCEEDIQTSLTSEESVPIHSLLSYLKLAEMLDSLLVTREIKNAGEILKQNPEAEY